MSFTKWFHECLRVERFPVPGEIARFSGNSHLINVSDEYMQCNAQVAAGRGVYYHWFPLNECTGQMGLNSLYAALSILHQAEHDNQPVLLHCAAGTNRSPMVRAAYYFLRTGRHLLEPLTSTQTVLINFADTSPALPLDEREVREYAPNMLLLNCQRGLLPALPLLEKFLKLLGTKLEELGPSYRGGLLTRLKLDIGLQ